MYLFLLNIIPIQNLLTKASTQAFFAGANDCPVKISDMNNQKVTILGMNFINA